MSFPRYSKYKPSGTDWLGDVPAHWEIKSLKHLASFTKGLTITKEDLRDEGIPCVNYGEIHSKYGFQVDPNVHPLRCVDKEYLDTSRSSLLSFEDFVFADTSEDYEGSGNFTYLNSEMPTFAGYHTIIVRLGGSLNRRFFAYLFDSEKFRMQIRMEVSGIKVFSISQSILKSSKVLIPPLAEQTQIANFLDRETAKIDALVSEQRRLIELLKEKRQAVISHAVTRGLNPSAPLKPSGIDWLGDVPAHWNIGKLKYITSFAGGGTPSRDNLSYWNGDISWVSPKDMKSERITDTEESITQVGLENSTANLVPPRRILLVVRSGILQHTIPIAINETEVALNQDMKALSFYPKKCLPEFFQRWVQGYNDSLLLVWSKQGATVESIEHDYLANTPIPLPPIAEQTAIVGYLDTETAKFDALTAEAERAITLLQERRTALISAAVTGQINVADNGSSIITQAVEAPYSRGFARQLLAAEILSYCYDHPTTGRVKLQKLIHLCEHTAEIEEIHGQYLRLAAGPFDNKIMFGIAYGLKKQKWFEEVRKDGRSYYRPLSKAGEHAKYLVQWKDQLPKVKNILKLLGHATTRQCEIVSTLYAAWNDLLIEGKSPSEKNIINEASSPERWHENKANIDPQKWPIALQWMKDHLLIPTGFGCHTLDNGKRTQ